MTEIFFNSLLRLRKDEAGQGLVEYLLILALIAFAATAGLGGVCRVVLTALLMAAVLSGAIAYFFNKRMRLSATQHALIRIVAANSDLPSGVTLGNKDITTIEWPSALPLPGSFTKVEDVVGRPLIYPLGAKEPVLKRDLGVEGSGIGLSAKIPAGMRATTGRSN